MRSKNVTEDCPKGIGNQGRVVEWLFPRHTGKEKSVQIREAA